MNFILRVERNGHERWPGQHAGCILEEDVQVAAVARVSNGHVSPSVAVQVGESKRAEPGPITGLDRVEVRRAAESTRGYLFDYGQLFVSALQDDVVGPVMVHVRHVQFPLNNNRNTGVGNLRAENSPAPFENQ